MVAKKIEKKPVKKNIFNENKQNSTFYKFLPLSNYVSIKKLNLSLIIALITLVIAFMQYDAEKVSLSQSDKEKKSQGLYKIGEFSKIFDNYVDKTTRRYSEGISKESKEKDGHVFDINDPPVPFHLVLTKSERDSLCIESQNITTHLYSVSSYKIQKLIDELSSVICSSGKALYSLQLKEGNTPVETKVSYLKKDVDKLRELISYLYSIVQQEIRDGVLRPNFFDHKIIPGNTVIDLTELKYGLDISLDQDINTIIEQSDKGNISLYIVSSRSEGGQLTKLEKVGPHKYQVKWISIVGKKYIIAALKNGTLDEKGEIVFLPKGVFNGYNLKGWFFTRPNTILEQIGKTWFSVW